MYESLPPELLKLKQERDLTDKTLETVSELINSIFITATKNNLWYYPPNICVNCFNEVVLEFWKPLWSIGNKLVFYIDGETIDYIKFSDRTKEWDGNLREEGSLSIEKVQILELWKWIAD